MMTRPCFIERELGWGPGLAREAAALAVKLHSEKALACANQQIDRR